MQHYLQYSRLVADNACGGAQTNTYENHERCGVGLNSIYMSLTFHV